MNKHTDGGSREREGVLVAIMLLVVSHSFVHSKNINVKKTRPCTSNFQKKEGKR
jgi:hypothetical protein